MFDEKNFDSQFVADNWEDEIADVEPLDSNSSVNLATRVRQGDSVVVSDSQKGAGLLEDMELDDFDEISPSADVCEIPVSEKLPKSVANSSNRQLNLPKEVVEAQARSKHYDDVRILQDSSDKLVGARSGIDVRRLKKLATGDGEFRPTARFDLHGFYMEDAYRATMEFLHESADTNHRCVLLITGKGKGYGEKGEVGLIKSHIAKWLSGHPRVLAFHTADNKHGGSGALYVLLKK